MRGKGKESNNLSKVFAVAGLIDSDLPPIKEQIQELAKTLNSATEYIAVIKIEGETYRYKLRKQERLPF